MTPQFPPQFPPPLPTMITISSLNEIPQIRHAFFTREGGVSEGIYASLNCGFGSSDAKENVATNRTRALAQLDLPAGALATLNQQHTAVVTLIGDAWSPDTPLPVADAMVTTRKGVALGILTADCAPVLFADPVAGVIGAAHAGWRGALGGVVENTVGAMIELGAESSRIVAAIGPCIAHRSYEVSETFPAAFLADDPESRFYFTMLKRTGRHYFDLPGYLARRLGNLPIRMVTCTPCDTFREETRFFSYRRATLRGETDYGRNLSAIVLEP